MPDDANCYYTRTLGTAQGTQARSVTAGEDVTVGFGTPTQTYSVSGITLYRKGLAYGGTFYAGENETVSLTLGYTGTPASGTAFSGYTASGGTLGGTGDPYYTLTMPGADVTISAAFSQLHAVTVQNGRTNDSTAAENAIVTITANEAPDGMLFDRWTSSVDGVTFADATSVTTTFTMPAKAVTVTATFAPDPAHFSVNDAGTEYTIHTAAGWNAFCECLNDNETYNRFSGKTVKLGANITVTRMAGSDYHDFCGTFDGDEHTLTFNCGSAGSYTDERYIAPFRYVSNVGSVPATIRNLRVAGDIYTSAKYAAGFISQFWGTVNIQNCRSSVVIHSSVSGDGTHGGFVAENKGVLLNITGCVFDGKLLTTGDTTTTSCGGFVGYGGTEVNINDSLYAPAALGTGETEAESASGTFNRTASNLTNCYYTRALGTAQGKAAHSVTAGEYVTVSGIALTGDATPYSVSGITAYSGGGLSHGGSLYYGDGDDVRLTLSFNREGYALTGYTASAGTLSGNDTDGYTLTMPDGDVTVSATFDANTYAVTVENGTGGGSYAAGASVTVTANAAESGKQFKEWTGVDGLTFTSGNASTATATFTMPANAVSLTATYEDIPKETTPTATFTATGADSGTLANVSSGMKYSLDGGTNWTDITATSVTISSGVTTTNGIQVKKPGNGTTTTDSDVQSITVTQPSAPSAGKADCSTTSNNDGKLTGVTEAMEYRKSDAASWTAGTGNAITGLVPGTYYVRVKATGTALASANQELTIKSAQTITADDVTANYGDTDKSVSASVTNPTTGSGAISYAVKAGSENYIEVDRSSGALTIKAVPPTDGKAYVTVTAAGTDTCVETTKEVTVTINRANPTATAPTGLTATYGQTLADVTLTNPQGNTPGTWAWADDTQSVGNVVSPAATFIANFTPTDTTNYNSVENVNVAVTVDKANAVAATVTGNSRTYDSTEKPLVTVSGEPTGGTMQYALGTETEATQPYTTSIPAKTDAGTYYVWYKAVGDANHLDTEAEVVEARIIISFGTPDLVMPAALTAIEESAFEGLGAITVVDAASVASIGANAFKDCANLTMIRLPKDCAIHASAFSGCGTVYVFALAGGTTEAYCAEHDNLIFIEE